MQTLTFDGRMGASGDMLLGALLAAGADPDVLSPITAALDVRFDIDRTTKNGISATTVTVLLDDGSDDDTSSSSESDEADERGHDHSQQHEHDDHHTHTHDDHHSHDHDHSHEHNHSDDHERAEGHGPMRTYAEVVDVVDGMDLSPSVKTDAKAVFELLGEAEASVHGTDLDSTHFHEVGADDAIADIVGSCLLVDDLDVERVFTTPVATGGGEVEMSHGTYPVPTPAVVEIAERADWQLVGGPVEAELLTPTGAAILAHFAEGVDAIPSLKVTRSGYGAGGYEFPSHPNVLRALVGVTSGGLVREDVTVLETNIDDASPELLGGLQGTLSEAGALDVSVLPATMKKSRPGHLVKVITNPEDAEQVARRLAEETGTLGVREAGASHRWVAHRRIESVTVDIGGSEYEVDVKVASDDDGTIFDRSAEYDDAAAVASETDIPIREVIRLAEDAARE